MLILPWSVKHAYFTSARWRFSYLPTLRKTYLFSNLSGLLLRLRPLPTSLSCQAAEPRLYAPPGFRWACLFYTWSWWLYDFLRGARPFSVDIRISFWCRGPPGRSTNTKVRFFLVTGHSPLELNEMLYK
jgi:hypothetical protein